MLLCVLVVISLEITFVLTDVVGVVFLCCIICRNCHIDEITVFNYSKHSSWLQRRNFTSYKEVLLLLKSIFTTTESYSNPRPSRTQKVKLSSKIIFLKAEKVSNMFYILRKQSLMLRKPFLARLQHIIELHCSYFGF